MNPASLKATDIFNMSFGQVFVAGTLEGHEELVHSSRWRLVINGTEVAELEALGEQLPKGPRASNQRIVTYKGSIDTTTLNLTKDKVLLLKIE